MNRIGLENTKLFQRNKPRSADDEMVVETNAHDLARFEKMAREG